MFSTYTVGLGVPKALCNPAPTSSESVMSTMIRESFITFITKTFAQNKAILIEGIKWALILKATELFGQGVGWIFAKLGECFLVKAKVQESDPAYDWLAEWFSGPEFKGKAKTFEVFSRRTAKQTVVDPSGMRSSGRVAGKAWAFGSLPAEGEWKYFNFEDTHMFMVRNASPTVKGPQLGPPKASFTVLAVSRTQKPVHDLIDHVRKFSARKEDGKLAIYTISERSWQWMQHAPRIPRKMSSVIMSDKVKDRLKEDIVGFYKDKDWYADMGIPHRRGYLLYGIPGSGKTSLCTALAGELGLRVYIINLSQNNLDDSKLNDFINHTQPRSMVLIEDIDCAFPKRDAKGKGDMKDESNDEPSTLIAPRRPHSIMSVTFSGLLNAIDGLAAQEGNIVFATTNHKDDLDPALTRPGRLDVRVKFENATKEQAHNLFLRFYARMKGPMSDDPETLAKNFAAAIPEAAFSMAEIQGFLIVRKKDPEAAVKDIADWVSRKLGGEEDTAA